MDGNHVMPIEIVEDAESEFPKTKWDYSPIRKYLKSVDVDFKEPQKGRFDIKWCRRKYIFWPKSGTWRWRSTIYGPTTIDQFYENILLGDQRSPPTKPQVDFAKILADKHGISMPTFSSKKAASDFIEKWKNEQPSSTERTPLKSRQVPNNDVRLTANIREDLHLRLKIEAARLRLTMGEIIENLIDQHIQPQEHI